MKKLKLEEALRLLEQAEVITCPELGSSNCTYTLSPKFENFLELEDDDTDVRGAYCFRFLKEDNQSVFVDRDLMMLTAASSGDSDARYLQLKLLAPINFED